MASPGRAQSADIDCLSPEAQRLAEARLAAKRAARAEAREIRMKELERQQKEIYQVQKKYCGLDSRWGDIERWMEDSERCAHRPRRNASASDDDERVSVGSRGSRRVEERPEKDFAEKGSRNLAGLSAATLASLGGSSSRRGSGDTSISIDTEASIREMKDSLAEAEEKYKKAMVSNAQLDNEKTHFMYQVDTLKDTLLDLEEQLAECRRQCEEKSKEFERERHAHSLLQFQFSEVKAALRQRDELLEKHGIVLAADVAANGETPLALTSVGHAGPTKVTKEELNALTATGAGALGEAPDVDRAGRGHLPPRAEGGQHGERPAQGRVDARGRRAEAPDTPGDSAASPAGTPRGQGQAPAPERTALPEPSEQGGAAAGTSAPQGEAAAAPVLPGGRDDVDGEPTGPASPQGGRRALGPQGPRLDAPAEQELGGPDPRAASGAASGQPCQAPAGAAAEEPATGGVEAKESGPGWRVGTAASGPPKGGGGPGSHGGEPAPGTGPGVEAELADQRGAGSRGDTEEEESEGGVAGAGPPAPGGVQGEPSAPGSPQAAAAPGPDADHEPLDGGDPEEERSEPQGDGPDPSPRKAKGKKRRNKKKKPPAPAEAPGDAEEPAGQGSGRRGDRAEERAGPAGGSSAEEAQAARSDRSAGPGSPVAPAAELRRPEAGVDAAAASEDDTALPADVGPRDGAARTSAPERDSQGPGSGRASPKAAPPEGMEGPEVRSGAESIGLGGGELAPEGERADTEAEGAEEPRDGVGDGKARAKEDCALS